MIFATGAIMYQETPAQKKPRNKKAAAAAEVKPAAPDVAYSVAMSRPATHMLEVEMRVKWAAMPSQLQIKMPVWTPGSYLIREYARHVMDLDAADAAPIRGSVHGGPRERLSASVDISETQVQTQNQSGQGQTQQ